MTCSAIASVIPRRAHVRLRLPDGGQVTLHPGDQIGRSRSAALPIDDARISEAHAMVSLRGTALKLLSLRGLFAIGGRPLREAVLAVGARIALAAGFEVEVLDVVLPARVMALRGDGLPRHALSGVNSLCIGAHPDVLPKYRGDADATIWSHGDAWRLSIDGREREVSVGSTFAIGERRFEFVSMPLRTAAGPTRSRGGVRPPLRVVAQFDTVQLHRAYHPALVLSGIGARIISELVAFDGPAGWEVIASQIWDDDCRDGLRARWDTALLRLRRKLKRAKVRADLIAADGTGNYELLLYEHDTVEDRT